MTDLNKPIPRQTIQRWNVAGDNAHRAARTAPQHRAIAGERTKASKIVKETQRQRHRPNAIPYAFVPPLRGSFSFSPPTQPLPLRVCRLGYSGGHR